MALIVVFVTANTAVIGTVTSRRAALVPSEMRADDFAALGGQEVVLSAFDATRGASVDALLDHLEALNLAVASGVVILTDDSLPGLEAALGDQFGVSRFVPPGHGKNTANMLSSTLSRCLRAFRYFGKRFDDLKYNQIFRLPLRNFAAPEVLQMRAACRNMMNQENYARETDRLLQAFRQRQRPKKASDYPDLHYVDDDEKYFRLGHELHARPDTAIPPHNRVCALSNQFRFGRAFEGRRHFNVSRVGKENMAGRYPDCHGALRAGGKGTHLNMFTNDFF